MCFIAAWIKKCPKTDLISLISLLQFVFMTVSLRKASTISSSTCELLPFFFTSPVFLLPSSTSFFPSPLPCPLPPLSSPMVLHFPLPSFSPYGICLLSDATALHDFFLYTCISSFLLLFFFFLFCLHPPSWFQGSSPIA